MQRFVHNNVYRPKIVAQISSTWGQGTIIFWWAIYPAHHSSITGHQNGEGKEIFCDNLQATFHWKSGMDRNPMPGELFLSWECSGPGQERVSLLWAHRKWFHFQVLFSVLAYTLGKNDEQSDKLKKQSEKPLVSVSHTQWFHISTLRIQGTYHKSPSSLQGFCTHCTSTQIWSIIQTC